MIDILNLTSALFTINTNFRNVGEKAQNLKFKLTKKTEKEKSKN